MTTAALDQRKGCRPRRRISEVVGKAKAGGGSTTVAREEPPVEGPAGMMRPHEVDAAWRALLEETQRNLANVPTAPRAPVLLAL